MISVKFKSLRFSAVDVTVNVTVSTSWEPFSVRKKGVSLKEGGITKRGASLKEEVSVKERASLKEGGVTKRRVSLKEGSITKRRGYH